MAGNNALTVSLIDLSRQLGSRKEVSLSWEAPDDLGTTSMQVTPGEVLDIDVVITSVDDGVLVQVDTETTLHGECVRCLDPVDTHHRISAAEVFFEKQPQSHEDDEDSESFLLIGPHDTIDLEALLRDSIVPLVDDRPLCSEDCEGLCQNCGEKWADLPSDHTHEIIDPRFAALQSLLESTDQ